MRRYPARISDEDNVLRHLYIIMGPAGCGKSSIASALHDKTGWAMIEADAHHSKSNVEKQAAGIPLTDEDRVSWIDSMVEAINHSDQEHMLLACSALTPYVQSRFLEDIDPNCHWFLLDVSRKELSRRLNARVDHFMSPTLLDDQLNALSAPDGAHRVDGEQTIEQICHDILALI